MISHKHNFVFIHIPKTGGSSIESVLKNQLRVPCSKGVFIHYDKLTESICSKYFMFSFCRNPWDRFVSLYHYWCFHHAYKRYINHLPHTFRYFCFKADFIFSHFDEKEKIHLLPQVSLNGHTKYLEHVDFWGKFENFQEDFNHVCDRIKIPYQDLPHLMKTNHKSYWEYYDDETRMVVAERYKDDIDCFDYEFRK